jgi:hypothetical protein
MSEPVDPPPAAASHEEVQTALFMDLIAQQANMAFMFLGRVPHPQTGQPVQDLETARLFIDQLEMLEAKTRGNLNKREEGLLKQSLMAARMAFVETIEAPPAKAEARKESSAGAASPAAASASPAPTPAAAETAAPPADVAAQTAADADDDRKKFVKKY